MTTDNAVANGIEILDFQPQYRSYFKSLNQAWIEKYFRMEPADYRLLEQPEKEILEPGGAILFARCGGQVAGTCGLLPVEEGVLELIKMAVDEKFQGRKIGYALGAAAVERAKALGARKMMLHSQSSLTAALQLYRKLGFVEIPLHDNHYERCDIQMELTL